VRPWLHGALLRPRLQLRLHWHQQLRPWHRPWRSLARLPRPRLQLPPLSATSTSAQGLSPHMSTPRLPLQSKHPRTSSLTLPLLLLSFYNRSKCTSLPHMQFTSMLLVVHSYTVLAWLHYMSLLLVHMLQTIPEMMGHWNCVTRIGSILLVCWFGGNVKPISPHENSAPIAICWVSGYEWYHLQASAL
jgi:hypothetical protein